MSSSYFKQLNTTVRVQREGQERVIMRDQDTKGHHNTCQRLALTMKVDLFGRIR